MRFVFLIIISFSVHAGAIKSIECGEYNEAEQLQLNHNKTYFEGRTESRYVNEGVDDFLNQFVSEFAESHKIINAKPDQIRKRPDFNTRRSKYYPIGESKEKYLLVESLPNPQSNHLYLKHTEIYPDITFNTKAGVLAGNRRGEFGGELILFSQSNTFQVLAEINVEDIYELPFGVVVISGLGHMSTRLGEIHIFNTDGSFEKLYNLLGPPRMSWLLNNGSGDLFINSGKSGSQVLTSSGQLQAVQCIDNKSLNSEASKAGSG